METNADTDLQQRVLEYLVACQRLTLMGRLSPWVTHEVNNHLTGVSGYAQLLIAQKDNRDIADELDKIYTSAGKCQRLIADLRRVGRFGNGEKEYGNINLIIQLSLGLVRRQFEKKSFRLVENYSPDIPPIEVDTPALEQVFLNIIQNSFEALQNEGDCFTISTFQQSAHIVALFEDTGPGLSETARAHLFTPFFTTKKELHCPGLGLAAAKMIIEAQEGTIHVDDAPGGGTSVRISIPLGEGNEVGQSLESR